MSSPAATTWSRLLGVADAGVRIDKLLTQYAPECSRAVARRLCSLGRVRLDGRRVGKGELGSAGALLRLDGLPAEAGLAALPDASVALHVRHVDPWLLVVDKPAGIPSHPLLSGELGTLASGLVAAYPELATLGYSPREPGLVHRLDTGTSGLLLVARTTAAFEGLRALLRAGGLDKRYLALCVGQVPARLVLTGWLRARGPRVRVSQRAAAGGRPIELNVLRSEPRGPFSLVEVRVLHAGRHQIRAQLAAAGFPLVGDALYGGPDCAELSRHFLHASTLALEHPWTGQRLQVHSPLPHELEGFLNKTAADAT